MKKCLTILGIVFLLLAFIPSSIFAQKIHLIFLGDTYEYEHPDYNIKAGVERDLALMNDFSNRITGYTGMEKQVHNIAFERDELLIFLADFQCDSDDVILFYFTGHGASFQNQPTDFPMLYIGKMGLENPHKIAMNVHDIGEELKAKGARLTLVFSDTCNDFLDLEYTGLAEIDPSMREAYKRLFLYANGYVLATSSRGGQESVGGSNEGSAFTIALTESVYALTEDRRKKHSLTWTDVRELVNKKTPEIARRQAGKTQEPLWETVDVRYKVDEGIENNVIVPVKN